jgi:hypothetical protein
VADPEVGLTSVVRIETAVVFPAPFGPRSPSTVPARTSKFSPSSAVTEPYFFTRLCAMMLESRLAVDIAFTVSPHHYQFVEKY